MSARVGKPRIYLFPIPKPTPMPYEQILLYLDRLHSAITGVSSGLESVREELKQIERVAEKIAVSTERYIPIPLAKTVTPTSKYSTAVEYSKPPVGRVYVYSLTVTCDAPSQAKLIVDRTEYEFNVRPQDSPIPLLKFDYGGLEVLRSCEVQVKSDNASYMDVLLLLYGTPETVPSIVSRPKSSEYTLSIPKV